VVAANAVNVVLNVVFIYGFGWGLAGSAWATVVAQVIVGRTLGAAMPRVRTAPRDA
jgi:Na+-driven multidrug efflux pump